MKAYVLDTHILWWQLTNNSKKLSRAAQRAFKEGERGEALLYVPVIALLELWDANQNSGGIFDFRHVVRTLQQASQFIFVPLDMDDVWAYDDLTAIPGSRDRMIAAAALKMSAPLITVDQQIIASGAVEVLE